MTPQEREKQLSPLMDVVEASVADWQTIVPHMEAAYPEGHPKRRRMMADVQAVFRAMKRITEEMDRELWVLPRKD